MTFTAILPFAYCQTRPISEHYAPLMNPKTEPVERPNSAQAETPMVKNNKEAQQIFSDRLRPNTGIGPLGLENSMREKTLTPNFAPALARARGTSKPRRTQ